MEKTKHIVPTTGDQMSNNKDKLTQLWLERLSQNRGLEISDLYRYSKIRLKKKRNKKKFNKDYSQYVADTIRNIYWGSHISTPIANSFKRASDAICDLKVEPMNCPKVELVYSNFKYEEK